MGRIRTPGERRSSQTVERGVCNGPLGSAPSPDGGGTPRGGVWRPGPRTLAGPLAEQAGDVPRGSAPSPLLREVPWGRSTCSLAPTLAVDLGRDVRTPEAGGPGPEVPRIRVRDSERSGPVRDRAGDPFEGLQGSEFCFPPQTVPDPSGENDPEADPRPVSNRPPENPVRRSALPGPGPSVPDPS